ncbi:hypothetical protein J2X61_006136 [Bacillus sp. 3255]|nr:hypothetical protein [Bacillus sp. 3255]
MSNDTLELTKLGANMHFYQELIPYAIKEIKR